MNPRTELYIMREFKTLELGNINNDAFENKTSAMTGGITYQIAL